MRVQTVTGPIRLDQLGRIARGGKWLPPYTYLFTDFVPMSQARGLTDHEIDAILDDNPRRFFAGEALPLMNKG